MIRRFVAPALVVSTLMGITGCVQPLIGDRSARNPLAEQSHSARLVVLPRPPSIAADAADKLPLAGRVAARVDTQALLGAGATRVTVDALPFLTQTEIGRAFLAAPGARALARGMPAESCPALGLAIEPGGEGNSAVAQQALGICLAALGDSHPGCGCRILALGDVLTVPRDEVGFATGVSARIQAPAHGLNGVLVAEDLGDGRVLLRGLGGPEAILVREGGGRASLTFRRDGAVYRGQALPVGFRRGRLAERIYATGPGGDRLSLLIGFSPEELAESAAAWLAWPSTLAQ